MKKKLIAVTLVTMMTLSLAACGGNKDNGEQTTTPAQTENKTENKTDAPSNEADTIGARFLANFKALMAEKPDQDMETLANALMEKGELDMAQLVMPVEPGLLNGFDNAEITGFKSGALMGPMIGSIPFIGYVFDVEGDVDAFVKNLKDNANLRWNICVEADEMVVDNVDNVVFFLMCPSSFEDAPEEDFVE